MEHQDATFFAPGSGNILAAFMGASAGDEGVTDAENTAPQEPGVEPAHGQALGKAERSSASQGLATSGTRKGASKPPSKAPLASVENTVRGEDGTVPTSTWIAARCRLSVTSSHPSRLTVKH